MAFPQIVRKVSKNKWLTSLEWLEAGSLSADVFNDIRTSQGKLSVYVAQDETQITQICTALACTTDTLANVDYVAVEQALLEQSGFVFDDTSGTTPYALVNDWHHDIVHLSVNKLTELALLFKDAGTFERIQRKKIKRLILDGINAGDIDRTQIKDGLRRRLD